MGAHVGFSQYSVRVITHQEANRLILKHYLHRWPGVVVLILGLFDREQLIGVIVFALPPIQTNVRYNVKKSWELARLFIEDCTPRNAETWFVARSLRWIAKGFPDVQLIVSYADPSVGHQGTIYKAGNWIADGRTDDGRKLPRCDYEWEGKRYSRRSHVPVGVTPVRVPRVRKFRFIYWTKDHEKKRQIKASIQT